MFAHLNCTLCGFTVLTAAGLMLVACADLQPQSTVSRGLESGITSSNGGGMMPADFGKTDPVKLP